MNINPLIARWESRSGKWYVELRSLGGTAYGYSTPGSVGTLNADNDAAAIADIKQRVDRGLFQPDNAKTPMRRVG